MYDRYQDLDSILKQSFEATKIFTGSALLGKKERKKEIKSLEAF